MTSSTDFSLRTRVLSIIGQSHSAKTSLLVEQTGATRADVLKAVRSLEQRGGVFKADDSDSWNGHTYSSSQRGRSGRYTDAIWVVNTEPTTHKFADLAALDRVIAQRGCLHALLEANGFGG